MQAELQDHLARVRAGEAPMPLVGVQAIQQAARLRATGMTYGGVSLAMAFYHGASGSSYAWRGRVRRNPELVATLLEGLR